MEHPDIPKIENETSVSPEERKMLELLPFVEELGRLVEARHIGSPEGMQRIRPMIIHTSTLHPDEAYDNYRPMLGVDVKSFVQSEDCHLYFRKDDAGDLVATEISNGRPFGSIEINPDLGQKVGQYYSMLAEQYSIDPSLLVLPDIPDDAVIYLT